MVESLSLLVIQFRMASLGTFDQGCSFTATILGEPDDSPFPVKNLGEGHFARMGLVTD
jgi:hypothetical protein